MGSSLILSVTTFVYGLAAALYLVAWVFHKDRLYSSASLIVVIGITGNTAGFMLRWAESYRFGIGHVPLSNLYESLVFFALVIAVLYLIVEEKYGYRTMGAFAMPLAFLAMAYASLSPNIGTRIQPLLPALKSNWLIAHVVTCFIGYATFGLAFGLSLMYLVKRGNSEGQVPLLSRIPERRVLDELTQQMIMFGFLFLSAGIITGAIWANSAWGRYWGWTPRRRGH